MKRTRDYNREFREKAYKDLVTYCPEWKDLSLYMDQFFSLILSKLKKLKEIEPENKYRLLLIVSFIRTHFVIIDLLESSDLIEAATLIRKQVEVLARLKELSSNPIKNLSGKTPNVRGLNLGPTYGSLSEIAHSSKFEPLALLGIIEIDDDVQYSVYPLFTQHTLTSISIYCDIFCKFSTEILQLKEFSDMTSFSSIAMVILNDFINIGKQSQIKYFEGW